MRKAYHDTDVSPGRSQEAIETLLRKHGVTAIRWTSMPDGIGLEFKGEQGSYALRASYLLGDAPRPEQRRRQVMRALHWYVKAKLEAVDFGLEDMVAAFLPHLITAPNRTLLNDVSEAMEQRRLGIDIPLLPEGR